MTARRGVAIRMRQLRRATVDSEQYQLLLDDLGELVSALGLPLGEMMNQSPRDVLKACTTKVGELKEALLPFADLARYQKGKEDWRVLFTQETMWGDDHEDITVAHLRAAAEACGYDMTFPRQR